LMVSCILGSTWYIPTSPPKYAEAQESREGVVADPEVAMEATDFNPQARLRPDTGFSCHGKRREGRGKTGWMRLVVGGLNVRTSELIESQDCLPVHWGKVENVPRSSLTVSNSYTTDVFINGRARPWILSIFPTVRYGRCALGNKHRRLLFAPNVDPSKGSSSSRRNAGTRDHGRPTRFKMVRPPHSTTAGNRAAASIPASMSFSNH